MHGLKCSDESYLGFGEAYFSTVNHGFIKGWKMHKKMTLNLVVPYGNIRFLVHDGIKTEGKNYIKPIFDEVLGEQNYSRLTIPPGYWVAFQGIGPITNILMNLASIEHDPYESVNKKIDFFNVKGFFYL